MLYKRGIYSAAISYLKEAEAGAPDGDPTVGVFRHHLAQAYEKDGDGTSAQSTLERALSEFEAQLEERLAGGAPGTPDPSWVKEARAMLKKLQSGA